MEKHKKSAIVKIPVIILAVWTILLCAVPCSAYDGILTVYPTDIVNLGTNYAPDYVGVDNGWADVSGTLNMYSGAYVAWGIYAYSGSEVNIYGGTIGNGYDIFVFDGANVTVYGTDFVVYDGTIDPSGDFFTVNDTGMLTGTYADGTVISLVFSSEAPIWLKDTSGADAMEVQIDIKPGSEQNSINLKSKGVVPVAVMATEDFFVDMIDLGTVDFAGAEPVNWSFEDVDEDGKDDIIFHFRTQELDLDQNSTEAMLTALLLNGDEISGTDEVRIVQPKK